MSGEGRTRKRDTRGRWLPGRPHDEAPKVKSYPEERFDKHKRGAARRGVGFELTFDEWWKIWSDSGRWNERSCGDRGYCMARLGDKGPYAVGNVVIVTNSENGKMLHRYRKEARASAELTTGGEGTQ